MKGLIHRLQTPFIIWSYDNTLLARNSSSLPQIVNSTHFVYLHDSDKLQIGFWMFQCSYTIYQYIVSTENQDSLSL